ncbi:hypothetical protein [Otarine picobirnavirus]|uniref:hypothetical protein n=1 Tax=Otarine picobirnavirus TaxID=1187973 RepID=UPI00025F3D4F|nr:hypothetical protein [Otarine picobirnavirus]AFJ79069.1 hypothetical protein [Otarine picobirnavirus]
MTTNQINFFRTQNEKLAAERSAQQHERELNEIRRSNLAKEQEMRRSNMAKENLGFQQFNESLRHNKATESQASSQLREIERHNRASVGLGYSNLSEQHRHNVASNSLGYANQFEQNRHDVAQELESQRHNTTTEQTSNFGTIGNVLLGVGGLFTKSNKKLKR